MSAGEQALPLIPGVPLALRGPAPVRVVAGFGFWLFLLSTERIRIKSVVVVIPSVGVLRLLDVA
jgi:hypothetical protein